MNYFHEDGIILKKGGQKPATRSRLVTTQGTNRDERSICSVCHLSVFRMQDYRFIQAALVAAQQEPNRSLALAIYSLTGYGPSPMSQCRKANRGFLHDLYKSHKEKNVRQSSIRRRQRVKKNLTKSKKGSVDAR